MQYSLSTFLIAISVVAILFVLGLFAFRAYAYGIDDVYAQSGAARMVIAHMKNNQGEWPANWESLRPQFDSGNSGVGGWSFEKYKSRVWVDFEVEVDDLKKQSHSSDKPLFKVIGAKLFTGVYPEDDPNKILWEYFRSLDNGVRHDGENKGDAAARPL